MRSSRQPLARKLYTDEPMESKPRHRRRKKGWWRLGVVGVCSLTMVTLTVIFYLGLCTRIVEKQYALDHYEALLPTLREENANLEIQVRALSKPSRIERIARAELHMDIPKSRIMLVEDNDDRPTPKYAWKENLQKI